MQRKFRESKFHAIHRKSCGEFHGGSPLQWAFKISPRYQGLACSLQPRAEGGGGGGLAQGLGGWLG